MARVELHEKLSPLIDELKSIRKNLEELKQKADNNAGLTKEIDHAFERIRELEKYLDSQSTGWRGRPAGALPTRERQRLRKLRVSEIGNRAQKLLNPLPGETPITAEERAILERLLRRQADNDPTLATVKEEKLVTAIRDRYGRARPGMC